MRVPPLAALAALSLPGCGRDDAPPTGPAPTRPWFVDVAGELGVDFVHRTGARGDCHFPEVMAGGVALFDADGDGDLDLYFTSGHSGLPGALRAAQPGHRFYRNDGDRFVDATDRAGLREEGYGMGVAAGDADGDGDVDLYVCNVGPDRLYRNRGDGTFEDATAEARIEVDGWSSSAAFLDADADGDLDVFVARYVRADGSQRCSDPSGRRDYCNPLSYPPEHDVLLRNRGDGTFEDATGPAGLAAVPACAGLGVVCADLDGDGWQDVYVANDSYPNHCWINRGDGTFGEDALTLGGAYNSYGKSEAGMGVVAADLDADGALDLFLTHLRGETNTLYRNLGRSGGFRDQTTVAGLGASSVRYTGFGVAAFDLDLDGDLDLALANGRVTRQDPLPGARGGDTWGGYAEPNLLYRNLGAGRFELLEGPEAAVFATVEVSRGLAAGDLDGDGDIDLVVVTADGPARVLRNDAPREGRWLTVRALDGARDALGARVAVEVDGTPCVRTVTTSGSYQSSSSPLAHFGLGRGAAPTRVDVRWADGAEEAFDLPGVERLVVVRRGEGRP